jgi:hypothetical protein
MTTSPKECADAIVAFIRKTDALSEKGYSDYRID